MEYHIEKVVTVTLLFDLSELTDMIHLMQSGLSIIPDASYDQQRMVERLIALQKEAVR